MKYTPSQIKSIPKDKLLKLINLGKEHIKKNKIARKMFEHYGVDITYIDVIPVAFDYEMDVSAQTVKGCVYLNCKLLEDGDFFKDLSYMVHEFNHVLSQTTSDEARNSTDTKNGKDYLFSPDEKEAFKYQVQYLEDQFGELAANDYVDHLLEYHDVQDAKLKDYLLD